MKLNIFLCYRRNDSQWFVKCLTQSLENQSTLEISTLFVDISGINTQNKIKAQIRNAITRSDVVLVIIGKDFLNKDNSSFDWVQYEVEKARNNKKQIIPIVFDGIKMPTKKMLPVKMRILSDFHALSFRYESYKNNFDKLVTELKIAADEIARRNNKQESNFTILNDNTGQLIDNRDGQVYNAKKINGKWWLVQNFNYKVNGSYLYPTNSDNPTYYGRYYSWEAALEAPPKGWRLPTALEWEEVGSLYFSTSQEKDNASILSNLIKDINLKFGGFLKKKSTVNNVGKFEDFWGMSLNGKNHARYIRFFKDGSVQSDKLDLFKENARFLRLIKEEVE